MDTSGTSTVGIPIARHLATLRQEPLLPIQAVLGATEESAVYRDASQRRRFDAQAWALVHYLTLGSRRGPTQLSSYVRDLSAGLTPEPAFTRAFQGEPESLGHSLADYVARFFFPVVSEKADGSESTTLDFTPLEGSEASIILADAFAQGGSVALARGVLQQLSKEQAQSANAQGLLGRIRALEGNRTAALQTFADAIGDPRADDRWRYYYAATLLNEVGPLEGSGSTAADARRAELVLRGLANRHPRHADVLALLGVAQRPLNNPGRAIQYLSKAFELCPRHQYILLLARAYLDAGDTAEARRLLSDLAARGHNPAVRADAATLLRQIPTGSQRALTTIPVYRTPAADEVRTAGALTVVTCAPQWIVFSVEAEDRTLRLAAASFERVDFLSYGRHHRPMTIGCGNRAPPERVFVIWKPVVNAPDDVEGFVRSVEFVPADRVP